MSRWLSGAHWPGASSAHIACLDSLLTELSDNPFLLTNFITLVNNWFEARQSLSHTRSFLLRATMLLNSRPGIIRNLNAVLGKDQQVIVVDDTDNLEVGLIVVKTSSEGEIIPISSEAKAQSSEITNSATLRSVLFWGDLKLAIMKLQPAWARCVMELLQIEISHRAEIVNKMYTRKCMRHLRSLCRRYSTLPPSFLIHDVTREGQYPVNCGGFADIWEGTLNNQKVCLKVLRFFLSASQNVREELLKSFCREALTWKRLDHPNVLPFLGVSAELFHPTFCLISPWMENGNLISFLEKHPEHDRWEAIFEIAEAIRYLHEYDPSIVHADIRGANILVSDDHHCRLADFGLASVTESQGLSSSSSGNHGSLRWMAPELLSPNPPAKSTSRDIYAFGCTILEIFTGKPPFHNHKVEAMITLEILNGKRPERPSTLPSGEAFPDEVWEIIERCWCQDPALRPSACDILEYLRERQGMTMTWDEIVDLESDGSSSLLFHQATPEDEDRGFDSDEILEESSMDDIINLYTPDLSIVTENLDRDRDFSPPGWVSNSSSSSPDSLLGRTYDSPVTEYSPPSSISPWFKWYTDSPTLTRSPLASSRGSPSPLASTTDLLASQARPRYLKSRPESPSGGLLSSLRDSWQTDHQTRKLRSRSRSALPIVTSPRTLELQHGRFKSMGNLSWKTWSSTGATASTPATSRFPLDSTTLPDTKITVLRSFVPPKQVNIVPYKIIIRVDPGDGRDTWDIAKTYADLVKLDQILRKILLEVTPKNWNSKWYYELLTPPKEKLWKDNAPARVDHRTMLLEKYLSNLLTLPLNTNRTLIGFFTSDVIESLSSTAGRGQPPGYKEGYLTKRGRRFGGWKTRYFYLAGGVLKYCESRGSSCIGSIPIIGSQVVKIDSTPVPAGDEDEYYRFGFVITERRFTVNGASAGFHILCAESDEERDGWVGMLEFASGQGATSDV